MSLKIYMYNFTVKDHLQKKTIEQYFLVVSDLIIFIEIATQN